MASKFKVILDHDGGVDDLIALAVLASSHESVDLIGVVCIDADCFIDPAVQVCGKLLSGMQAYGRIKYGASTNPFEYLGGVPVGRSTLTAVHEFPREWRALPIKVNNLPVVNTMTVLEQWEANKKHEAFVAGSTTEFQAGEELLAELVMKQGSPTDKVTICVTGPLSNIAYCVKKYGKQFTDNVEAVVIMGGAVDVHGNVGQDREKSTAEWNIYWDAPSAKIALECPGLKNVLFALDATNSVPVTQEFVRRFGLQKEGNFLSEFIGSAWAMCTHFSAVYGEIFSYYAWDTLTAAWIIRRDIVEGVDKVPMRVIVADESAEHEGRTMRLTVEEAVAAQLNNNCLLARGVRVEEFYNLMLSLATRV